MGSKEALSGFSEQLNDALLALFSLVDVIEQRLVSQFLVRIEVFAIALHVLRAAGADESLIEDLPNLDPALFILLPDDVEAKVSDESYQPEVKHLRYFETLTPALYEEILLAAKAIYNV